MNGLPNFACMWWASSRPNRSVVPPAENGTMKLTCLAGQSCASADAASAPIIANAPTNARIFLCSFLKNLAQLARCWRAFYQNAFGIVSRATKRCGGTRDHTLERSRAPEAARRQHRDL